LLHNILEVNKQKKHIGTIQKFVVFPDHLVTPVFYGFLFLCDFSLVCHVGFKAIVYRVETQPGYRLYSKHEVHEEGL
jgi:hypothetical protein